MTHRLELAGQAARLEREHKARAWAVWHTAWMMRVKKPPTLEELQGGKAQKVIQSADEMRGVFRRMRATMAEKGHEK
jgi:hypothetical protein